MVHLEVFGTTTATVNGQRIHLGGWADRQLLAALAATPGRETNEHIGTLAHGARFSPRAMSSSLYRLRRLLGSDAFDRVRGEIGLNRHVVTTDVDIFCRAVATGMAAELSVTEFVDVMSSVKGTPFAALGNSADPHRDRLCELAGAWAARLATDPSKDASMLSAIAGAIEAAFPNRGQRRMLEATVLRTSALLPRDPLQRLAASTVVGDARQHLIRQLHACVKELRQLADLLETSPALLVASQHVV